MKDRVVEKVFKILDLFLYNKSVTTKLIVEETGMSMRSAQRYLKDSMEFLDIKQNDDKSYTLISKDKLSQYIKRDDSYLTATLLQYAKSMYPKNRHDAVERLFNLFNIKNLESAIQVLESSSIDFDKVQSVVAELSYYIKTPMKIQFDYMKGNKENKHKTTSPYKILYYNGFWYLIGCNDNKEIRAYRLDYIENIKPSSDNTKYVELDEKSKKMNKSRNKRQRAKKLAGTLNCNFKAGDFHIVLTARENAREQVADTNAIRNFLRRLMYAEGRKLKFVWVQEHHDSNVHYHLVIEKCKYRNIKKSWPYGWANIEKLAGDDKIELAMYLSKEADRYHVSRGLNQPAIIEQTEMSEVQAKREMTNGTFNNIDGWLGKMVAEKREI